MTTRRAFITGLIAAVAAPSIPIVREAAVTLRSAPFLAIVTT